MKFIPTTKFFTVPASYYFPPLLPPPGVSCLLLDFQVCQLPLPSGENLVSPFIDSEHPIMHITENALPLTLTIGTAANRGNGACWSLPINPMNSNCTVSLFYF